MYRASVIHSILYFVLYVIIVSYTRIKYNSLGIQNQKKWVTPNDDIPARQRLRSSISDDLFVPVAVRLPTVGRRAFSVAGAPIWNDLPADVTSAPSLLTFRRRLKLHLFRLSYPGLVLI